MARGINKVILVGNLGRDPETRYMQNGAAVTNVSVATTKAWRDRDSGENRERTEWHRVVFFNRLAEIAGEHLRRGSQVYVEGELRTREWEKEGQKHYSTEIVANELQMMGSRPDGGGGGSRPSGGGGGGGGRQSYGGGMSEPAGAGGGGQQDYGPPPQDDFDDDIPF